MKTILQILGIASFFFLVGYALTYPYELSYKGDDEIILIEDSYEYSSFEEIINREEFKNKVLYITHWEPFDTELIPYSEKELGEFRLKIDSLKSIPNSAEYKRLLQVEKGRLVKPFPIEDQLKYFFAVSNNLKNRELEFIYIADPDNDLISKHSEIRMWKAAIKKFQIAGHHFVLNPDLSDKVREQIYEITNNIYLPQYCLVNKQGSIVDFKVPDPGIQ